MRVAAFKRDYHTGIATLIRASYASQQYKQYKQDNLR